MKPIQPKISSKEVADFILETFTPDEMVEKWAQACLQDQENPLTCGFNTFDQIMKKRLRGRVGLYAGYGGTKKSMAALASTNLSILRSGRKVNGLYGNMEMSLYQYVNRLLSGSFTQDEMPNTPYADFAEIGVNMASKASKEAYKKLISELQQAFIGHYGKSLRVTQKTKISAKEFYNTAKHFKSIGQPLDMLIVDGLSMMDTMGKSELDALGNNSAEIKEIANDFNIYIPLIVHLSKGARKHDREIMHLIRGSEKIVDNMDFSLQFSLIIDPNKGTQKAPVYLNEKGWVRLYDKRGSGVIMDKIYDFDPINLRITETNEDPLFYEVKEERNGF